MSAGISYTQFWKLAPSEVFQIVFGYQQMKQRDLELQSHAFRIGVVNALNNKDYPVFKDETDEIQEISTEEYNSVMEKVDRFPTKLEVR